MIGPYIGGRGCGTVADHETNYKARILQTAEHILSTILNAQVAAQINAAALLTARPDTAPAAPRITPDGDLADRAVLLAKALHEAAHDVKATPRMLAEWEEHIKEQEALMRTEQARQAGAEAVYEAARQQVENIGKLAERKLGGEIGRLEGP